LIKYLNLHWNIELITSVVEEGRDQSFFI